MSSEQVPEVSEKVSEKLVDVTVFSNEKGIEITSYTGTWCNPCKRIKPDFLKYMASNNYKLVKTYSITKQEYKNLGPDYKLVPFFTKSEKGKETSIQTSTMEDLTKFLSGFVILEDF